MRLTGLPTIYDIDPFETRTVQQHAFGTVGYDTIGRKYRYAKAGATALVKGNLLQSPARDTAFTDMAVQTAAAAGVSEISVTLGGTATTADLFNNGTLVISVTPGIGQNFTVKEHEVKDASATCKFTVHEKVLTALTTASKVTVTQNPFDKVIASPTARTGVTVGVALTATAASSFCWIGVEGVFGVLSDVSVAAVGDGLRPSVTTAGCVSKAVTLIERIGTAYILGVSAEVQPCFLNLP